jgi:hypothetical protein
MLICTRKSLRTWAEEEAPTPGFSILEVAIENWEWSCFRHYRESFRSWALRGNPCDSCTDRLRQMARNVEYDRIETAEEHLDHARGILLCLSKGYERTDMLVPSLEPFTMILKQTKNRRWMALWAPLIHMHTGFTVTEIYETYIESSQEREIQGATTKLECIPGIMFEQRDLQHVANGANYERSEIEDQMNESLGNQGGINGVAPLPPWIPFQQMSTGT